MPDTANSFIWYELMTTHPDAALAFYRPVVGWNAEDMGQGGMRYTVVKAGDHGVGGVMGFPPGVGESERKPGWIGYIAVSDVNAAARRISEAGGAIHRQPDDIPGVGRFAVVADPQGAAFMLLAPFGEAPPAPPPSTPGLIGWRELYTTDWQAAFAFYADQFGWTKDQSVDMGPMGTYQLFAVGGEAAGGMMNDLRPGGAPTWGFYFIVEGIDAAAVRIAAHGGRVVMGPHEVPGGSWIVQAVDPQGAMFALTSARR